jgi:KipI family sensor histidine kinase inhibitor
MRFLPAGDAALIVEFGDRVDPALNDRALALDAALAATALPGVVETIPTYRSLLVQYDPLEIGGYDALVERLAALASATDNAGRAAGAAVAAARHWAVPVAYGGPFGVDLDEVAARHGLTPEQAIELHLSGDYRVYMIGFAPGFAYLGGLPEALHTPRRENPRSRTPAGSISIGGIQAAVASMELPSGWHLLGRTPVRTFHPGRAEPFLFRTGDRIRFRRIAHDAFEPLARRAGQGEPVAELLTAAADGQGGGGTP